MNSFKDFIIWLNNRLVGLYPSPYQEEFADEIRDVFSQTVLEAAKLGNTKLTLLFLREIRDYPINLFQEHWLNLTKKEPVMVTNSPSIGVNVCPRCGFLRTEESRYCVNCGRSFIPFHISMLEKLKFTVNTKLFFIICCLVIMAILSPWAAELIINGLYHPVSLIVFSVLVAGFSVILGWRLARKKSNGMRLLVVALISVFIGLTFIGLGSLDRAYLRSVVDEDQTLAYNVLGMDTFITKLESEETYSFPCENRDPECLAENLDLDTSSGRAAVELQEPEFISSVCEDQGISCMIRHMSIFSDMEKPKILVERSWNLSEPAYQFLFIAYAIGLTLIGYRITRNNSGTRMAAS